MVEIRWTEGTVSLMCGGSMSGWKTCAGGSCWVEDCAATAGTSAAGSWGGLTTCGALADLPSWVELAGLFVGSRTCGALADLPSLAGLVGTLAGDGGPAGIAAFIFGDAFQDSSAAPGVGRASS